MKTFLVLSLAFILALPVIALAQDPAAPVAANPPHSPAPARPVPAKAAT